MPETTKMKTIYQTIFATVAVTAILWGLSAPFIYGVPASEGLRARAIARIDWPIAIHLATVIPCFFIGGFILARPKGTPAHKILGKVYAVLMITTAITAFFIHSIGQGFSFIHLFSVFVLISVPLGVRSAMKGDIKNHMRAMRGNYIGLCVAGAFTFVPGRIMYALVFGS